MAAVTISKYFESEMAAKDPELTLALFVAMGVTFGAAGLAAGGSASMKGVVGLMSKILTLNGKIGISATQMQGAIGAISDEWMRLTFTEGTMKTIIMNGFALPKVIYAFGNLMLKSSDKKDVFHRITTRLETQDLAGYTDKEKAAQLRTEIMVGTLLFAASIALGLGATTLAGLGTSGFLPTVGHYVGTGVSLLVDVKPEVFLDVGTASGLGAEFVAIAAMILTIKSSALFLGKVALVLGHMSGEECSKEEREICMMMASIKDGLDTGKIREEDLVGKIDTPEFQSWRSKLVGLIEKNDEVRDLYDTDDGRDFLIKIGAEVTPKPLLNRFLSTSKTIFWDYVAVKGIGQPLYAIISSVLRIPAIVLGFGTLWDFNNKGELSFRWGKDRADWKGLRGLENASDPLGFKEASWKPVMFLTKLAITVSALIKTVTISTWGTLQSVGMATTDLLADIAATVNYMMRRFRPDIPGGTVIGIGLGIVFGAVLFAEKLLFTGLSIANKIVDFGLKAVGYATTIVTGVVGLIATAIIGPFVRGIGGKDAFNTFWNGMKEFMKGPVTLSELWNEHVYKPFKAAFAEIIQGMDQEIYSVKGSDKIVSVRDQATGGIARIFDWVKEKAGEVAYGVRNFFVRSQEHHLQITHKQEMDAIDSQIEEEVDELRDCIMIDESEHMQGLGAAGVDKGKDDMEDRLKKLKEPEPQQDLVTVLGSSVIDDYQPEPAALRQS